MEDGTIDYGLDGSQQGTAGEAPVQSSGPVEEAPEGEWIQRSAIIYVTDPPCVDTYWEFLEGASPDEADAQEQLLANSFIAEYEAFLSNGSGIVPQPCPAPDGEPGIDPTPAQEFADSAEAVLPVATPTISGGYAITGLRAWLDLGRDSTFTTTRELDLGGVTYTATFTATATTTVRWGDGTVTTHTTRGGPYHDGEPGPDDIVHTYTDRTDSTTLAVVDTWDITVSVPVLAPINLTYEADEVTLEFPVREVRSSRDS